MAGVTSQGFIAKTQSEIQEALKGVWRGVLGVAVNVADRSRNGQLIAAISAPLAEVWKLGESITSFFSNPSGIMLDYVAALTGTVRQAAAPSSVVLTLTGVPTTLVPTGRVASVNGTSAQFQTTADATIVAMAAWATGTVYTAGARRHANGNVYRVVTPGTSAGAGTGPSGTGSAIADNDVVWAYLGPGTGSADVDAVSTVTGPVQGYAGTINIISTPVSGWNGVTNILDAAPGRLAETDPELRVRRLQEVAAQGKSPINAIRAQLLKVPGVTSAVVFSNNLDVAVDGIAAHGIECLVEGGDDQAIADAIFNSSAGGIETSGAVSSTVADTAGNSHTVKHSRPADVDIHVSVGLLVDVTQFPANGLDQVKAAVVAAGDALPVGRDVFDGTFRAAAMAIPGVLNVTSCFVGTAGPPGASTVVITPRQRAAFDTSRVTVTSVPGTA